MRIGLDFDGTVVVYDELFHRYALASYGMPAEIAASKPAIREWFWRSPSGKERWTELQGLVYGLKMDEAKMAPGLSEFLRSCRESEISVCVISHKTEFSAADPRVNLRSAALRWLSQNGFFDPKLIGLGREDVFFEATREAKIQRIIAESCTLFVDDLEEVFAEPSFPGNVEKWLYSTRVAKTTRSGATVFSDWSVIQRRVSGQQNSVRSSDEAITLAVTEVMGERPESIIRLTGGANNVVTRVVVNGRPAVAKLYFAHPGDPRDRLGTEFAMLDFLSRNGVRSVPQPFGMKRGHRVGLYEFIEGVRPSAAQISSDDVLQLAGLLKDMWRLRDLPDARSLPNASEAAFTLEDYWNKVQARLGRLRKALAGDESVKPVRDLVEHEISDVAAQVKEFVGRQAPVLGLDVSAELPFVQRTLSPADHGFHNTLRLVDGRLVFLDFEYAGWDDPAQMLANACLLPEIPLPAEFRLLFLRSVVDELGSDPTVVSRLRLIYPMLALKWSLIMLNEFVPIAGQRRLFAGANGETRRDAQLIKSSQQLDVVRMSLKKGFFLDDLVADRGDRRSEVRLAMTAVP